MHVRDTNSRQKDKINRLKNTAEIIKTTVRKFDDFISVRRFCQDNSIDAAIVCIQDSYGKLVALIGSHYIGDIQDKWRFTAFVRAHVMAIEPHIRQIIDGVESKQPSAFCKWLRAGL